MAVRLPEQGLRACIRASEGLRHTLGYGLEQSKCRVGALPTILALSHPLNLCPLETGHSPGAGDTVVKTSKPVRCLGGSGNEMPAPPPGVRGAEKSPHPCLRPPRATCPELCGVDIFAELTQIPRPAGRVSETVLRERTPWSKGQGPLESPSTHCFHRRGLVACRVCMGCVFVPRSHR